MSKVEELLQWAKDRGFDKSYITEDKKVELQCSQCQALVINGIPTHEIQCPNQKRRLDEDED